VKLYSYSSELCKFVEIKWVMAKYVIGGIIIGVIILFCAAKLNQSAGKALGFYSTTTLAAENNFLRYQVNFISAKVSKLEMQVDQLNDAADNYYILFRHLHIPRDTVLRSTNVSKGKIYQPSIYAAKNFSP
jgi:hypothetical protein